MFRLRSNVAYFQQKEKLVIMLYRTI